MWRYYRKNKPFAKLDIALWAIYASRSPFQISKEFLKRQGSSSLYDYGETPLTTLELIVKECSITSEDIFLELGSGTGRACFWMAYFIHCHAIGIEYISEFVSNAKALQKRFEVKKIEFIHADLSCALLFSPTVIYLYGTTMSDEEILTLTQIFEKFPSGTKLITVSWSFEDIEPTTSYKVIKTFQAPFPWGEADLFLQERQ